MSCRTRWSVCPPPLNIVVLYADDWRFDTLGVAGNPVVKTPNLDQLAREDPSAAQLVKFRYFLGMTMEESAAALHMAPRTAEALWTYARVWLRRQIRAHS